MSVKDLFTANFFQEFALSKFLLVLAIFLAAMSLAASAITVLSRLHDLRLTRHTIWIRKKSYDKYNKEYEDDYIDIDEYSFIQKMENFLETIGTHKYFINDRDIEDEAVIENKFKQLRLRNLLLARFSWNMMNCQFLTLAISVIVYVLSNFF